MASTLRPVAHDERLSLVEHLDELRSRIIVCVLAFAIACGVCLWQSDAVLSVLNHPLQTTPNAHDPLQAQRSYDQQVARALGLIGPVLRDSARNAATPQQRAAAARAAAAAAAAAHSVPPVEKRRPVLPAFSPSEREVALPLMLLVPFLFVGGVAFAYFLALPAAIHFLQNFNASQFNILIQARDLYGFSITFMGAMGLLFQLPVGILAFVRMGIITTAQLKASRRYAWVICAVVAAALPGTDPVSMLLEMVPLLLLFEGSILLCTLLDRRMARSRRHELAFATAGERYDPDPDD
jgi:sec-independent protein translocase protein TatC